MPITPDPWQVKLELDVPEPRTGRARIVAAADGTTWDIDKSVDILVEPVARTAFPMPNVRRADWATSSGTRLKVADYSGLTSALWMDLPRRGASDWYIQSAGGLSETATTTSSYPANQAWHLSAFVSGVQSASEQVFLECGWGVPGASGSVTLRFRHGGSVTVIKGSEPVGRYDWNGGSLTGAVRSLSTPEQQRTINLTLIPCRWRSLLCLIDGGGFEHVFGDLDALASVQPTIVPAGSFWWRVPPEAGAACVQLAPVEFAASATLYSRPISLRMPPPTGSLTSFVNRVFSDVVGVVPGAGPSYVLSLVDAISLAPFSPDGTARSVRLKLVLTRDSGAPFGALGVCAADMTLPPTGVTTYNAPKNVTNRFEIALDVPEAGPTTIRLHTTMPKLVETIDSVPQFTVTTDRPVGLKIGSLDVFRGTLAEPINNWAIPGDWPLSTSFVGGDRDIEPGFSDYLDARPFDNELMINACGQIWQDLGVSLSDLLITVDGFKLPYSPRASLGEWLLLQEAGQTRGEWLERFRRDYAATWIMGWRPTETGYKWIFGDPDSSPYNTSQMTLFEGTSDALAAGVSASLAPERVIRGASSAQGPIYTRIAPPCNHVAVVGYDPRRRQYVYASVTYPESQDPTTAPNLRPVGWRGRLHAAIRPDQRIQDVVTAERVRDILDARAARPRERVEWKSRFLIRESDNVPIWRGDLVTIMKSASVVRGVYRVKSLKGKLIKNVLGERPYWEMDYTAERILEAA